MPVIIDHDKCQGHGCCVEACPSEAIQIVDGKAVLKEEECVDCGACETECPTGAITVE